MPQLHRCFVCGLHLSRGLKTREVQSQLVSVGKRVAHSTAIIADILSRILNETIMQEEIVCKPCFSLLNDIDYHLKEAQEKTDEITHKFLDKEKQLIYDINTDQSPVTSNPEVGLRMIDDHVDSTKRPSSVSMSTRGSVDEHEEDVGVVEGQWPKESHGSEMSVNVIGKQKQRLLSHILKPQSKKIGKRGVTVPSDDSRINVANNTLNEDIPLVKQSRRGSKVANKSDKVGHHDADTSIRSSKIPHEISLDSAKTLLIGPEAHNTSQSINQTTTTVNERFQCEKCPKTFKKRTNLLLHVEKVHTPNHPISMLVIPETHSCSQCPREFTTKEALSQHMIEHESLRDRPATPPAFNKPVVNDTSNEGVKATCNLCGKTFRRHFNLKVHMDRVHNKVRPFACEICDKSFATNSDLRQHASVHGQGRVFKCELCSRTFTNRDSIILHRKQHANERTHFCFVCEKGFFKASCLARHMRSHTGDKPFKCQHCSKQFSQSTTLKAHLFKCSENKK